MRFDNPTSLRIGMSGTIAGTRYRVVGRVVMGMQEGGATYYWNEFNLVNDAGKFATLVFEETKPGALWKMFTLFEPQNPLTAAEAAKRRVGDTVNFQGKPLRVTLVDESRVYFIEGQAPEGVEVGDIAHYFNAEAGDKMQVASWTGDEIEFFNGMNLPGNAVRKAFGLSADPSLNLRQSLTPEKKSIPWTNIVVACFFVIILLSIASASWSSDRSEKIPAKQKLAPPKLVVGESGKLLGKDYKIEGHSLVDIAEVGRLYQRHEYALSSPDGNAVLIYGVKPGARNWYLFNAIDPATPMDPMRAARIRVGQKVDVEGHPVAVTALFRSNAPKFQSVDDVWYGFSCETPTYILLAQWNTDKIEFYRGVLCAEKTVLTAFK